MATSVKLSDSLVAEARHYGSVYSRSTPKQIEYWSRIGKIAEENPDLSYAFIREILLAQEEAKEELSEYEFGDLA
ncbi:hypothetical protein KAI87_05555 [Myxococcota bacterium]|nr:hypothetical protein [Myxococcota bacterium]